MLKGNRGTRLDKLVDENMVNKFITKGTNKENVWEHGNIEQFWKGTRTPLEDPPKGASHLSEVVGGIGQAANTEGILHGSAKIWILLSSDKTIFYERA